MKAKNNTVYILSSSFYTDEVMYSQNSHRARFTLKLSNARVFKLEDQARHFLDKLTKHWRVQPISSKIIFEARLKGI